MERVKEYSELPKEGPEFVEPRPPEFWPVEGYCTVDLKFRIILTSRKVALIARTSLSDMLYVP